MKKEVTLTIKVDEKIARLLAVLDEERDASRALNTLAHHAMQGVYRPGAWEREWVVQAFGREWGQRLEPGCPFGRANCEHIFQRPRIHGREGR